MDTEHTAWSTADLCDASGDSVQVLAMAWRDYGGTRKFCGPVATVTAWEDNSLVRTSLEQPGAGRVLVVEAGGSLRCAMLGDQLGELAVRNGWAGVVVHGAIRDAAALSRLPLGVKALGTNPRKSEKLGAGRRETPVSLGGATFGPDSYLYADEDGVIVAPKRLH
jgi:regulator of ribonuclease activity A